MTYPLRRRAIRTGAALATVALMAAPAAAQDDVVNVYNWSDYIAEDTIPTFEEKTGVEVNYDVYDSNEVLEGKLMAGNTGYDVVVPSGVFLARQIEAGIYQKLDKSKLDNWNQLDPEILKRAEKYDPGNKYGVPYMWGTTGYGYNVGMVKERLGEDAPTDSWDLFFKPENLEKLQDCGVAMLDSPTDVFPVVKNYLGYDPDNRDPEVLAEAEALLTELRPYIKYYHSSQYINDLANGDVCLAMGWSGDVFIARDRAAAAEQGVTVDYTIPKEGTIIWFDIMAIPKGAPHPEAALKWINYNMDPEVAAGNVNYVWYASANKGALPMIDDEIKNDPAIYPPKEVKAKLFADAPDPQKYARLRTRAWTRIKTGQ